MHQKRSWIIPELNLYKISDEDPLQREINRERHYDHLQQCVQYNALEAAVAEGEGELFFLDAPAGTEKSTVIINIFVAAMQSRIVICSASTAIAALLLTSGDVATRSLLWARFH